MPVYEPLQPSLTENTWWGLTELAQNAVKSTIPDKDAWTLDCYKAGTIWQFSLPQYMTFNEGLVNGTEKALDWHFINLGGGIPTEGSHMKLTCINGDIIQPEEYTTKLKWLYNDELWTESNFYYDTVSGKDCWLCPYLQTLFKTVPLTLYLQMEVIPDV